jgi:hypothetical protein
MMLAAWAASVAFIVYVPPAGKKATSISPSVCISGIRSVSPAM